MAKSSPDPQASDLLGGHKSSGRSSPADDNGETSLLQHADLSSWMVWAVLMLISIAILPFAVRNQDVVRAIARMCGFDLE